MIHIVQLKQWNRLYCWTPNFALSLGIFFVWPYYFLVRPHLVSDLTNDVLIKKKLFAALFNKGLQLSWTIHRKFLKLGQGKEKQGNGSIEIIIQRNFSTVIQFLKEKMVFSLSLYLSQYFWTCKRNMVKSPSLTTLLPNYTMYFIIFVDAESIELLWHYPGRFNPRLQYYYKKMVSLFLIPVTGVKSICCWLICASINQSHINFIIIWFIFSILFIGYHVTCK